MTPERLAPLKSLLGITTSDLPILRRHSECLLEALPRILDQFYDRLCGDPLAQEHIKSPDAWRRHRDGVRAWVVTITTQEDSELEEFAMRAGRVHAELGIPSDSVVAALSFLMFLVSNELSSSPSWDFLSQAALRRRWSYAMAIMIGTYEDMTQDVMTAKNQELQRALERIEQQQREVAGFNKMLQQMMGLSCDVVADKPEASAVRR